MIVEVTKELIDSIKNERNTTTKVRKLTNDEVRLIRRLDQEGLKNGEIAKLLTLPPQYVSHVRLNKAYKDVQGVASLQEATNALNATAEAEVANE